MTAHYSVHEDVAVITLDNPPVNGLGHATRLAIVEAMAAATDDVRVRAIVITGAGSGFSAGADVREFGTPSATLDILDLHFAGREHDELGRDALGEAPSTIGAFANH